MSERGAQLNIDDFHAGTASLKQAGINSHSSFDHSSALRIVREQNANLKTVADHAKAIRAEYPGDTGDEIASRLEGSAAVVAHHRALQASGNLRADNEPIEIKPVRYTAKANNSQQAVVDGIEDARKHYQVLAHRDIKHPTDYVWQANRQRRGDCESKSAGFKRDKINVGAGRYKGEDGISRTALHEWGHAIESDNPKLTKAAYAYYDARTKGEPLVHLGKGYKRSEMTRKDKLHDNYMGKDYVSSSGKRYGTELTSMGAEKLRSAWEWGDMHRKDPDTAYFTLGQLAHQ